MPDAEFTELLADGFAKLIADSGIGFTWRPTVEYAETEVGIFIADTPDKPTQLATVSPYPLTIHETLTDSLWGVQVRFRSGKRITKLWTMRDAVRSYLHGRFPITLQRDDDAPPIYVTSLVWSSGASLGRDADQYPSWSDNYQLRVSTHLP